MAAEVSRAAAPAASISTGRGPAAPTLEQHPKLRADRGLVLALLIAGLLICIFISSSIGYVRVPMSDLVAALVRQHPLTETQHEILFGIRLPRVVASAIVGAALALSGLMFQGLFRNPLADPYIIGASGGAVLGACIGIVFLGQMTLFGFSATALLAFLGAALTMFLVYALARTDGRTSGITLLLAGFAIGTMLGNSTYLFELFDPNPAFGQRIVLAWLHGSIDTPEWPQLLFTLLLFVCGCLGAIPLMRRLNTLALGDEYALQLGIRVESTRLAIIVVASLLTAIAVSLGGLISFAGLIVPHVVRLFVGADHVRLLPVTLLSGAIFLVITDTLARTVFAPTEIPVGIIMVVIGGPFFLYLLRKDKRGYAI